ncbi:MAG: hypothetical protein FJZ47_18185 [Candidatus Tectomicrobia bacterium]|uniref:Uncharacterized protein n=1 Tax=Tectimicrobiota bacterium TaxID=2528274 RepID=A0A937W4S1_UNCTE|nr:hypothetical protein [Candidatus Tectomicrobia bacterium]
MSQAFAYPFMYWVGMTTPADADPAAVEEFSKFYSTVHVPEVLANNPGFVRGTRYELVQPDPRGGVAPRWLAVYEMDGEAAARTYAARNDGPPEGRPKYTRGPALWAQAQSIWRMIWQQVSATGTASQLPHSIFMVGMNVPSDTDDAALAAFNTFYTHTHVPEVMERGRYARSTRFALHRAFRHPQPRCPRFCAIYEADAASTQANQERRGRSTPLPGETPLSSGPPAWERHDTLWRLVYRRIDF